MLTTCLVKLISILLNYIDVRGKATNKLHVFKQKKKKKKGKTQPTLCSTKLAQILFSFTFMKPKCRLKILTRTSVFVVSDLQLQYLQMSGNFSSTLINSGNFINNNFILFFRSKASLIIQQRLKSRGFSTKFNTWGLRPEVQPLTLLYTILDRKGPPLVYLLWTNGTPFTYLLWTSGTPFTYLLLTNGTSFTYLV